MKKILIALVLLTSVPSFSKCLFGDDLVDTARMKDLIVSEEQTLNKDSKVNKKTLSQIIKGVSASLGVSVTSYEEALKYASYSLEKAELWVRSIKDTAHDRNYRMYLFDAGGNIYGFFINTESNDVEALITDGQITSCETDFEDFDRLDWFYTN